MIVEPVPTAARSRWRRALQVGAMAFPVVLLGAVVAAGLLGPQGSTTPSPGPDAAAADAGASASTPPGATDRVASIAFPETWIGLRVLQVSDALAARASGKARGIVAVAGYLSYGRVPFTCMDVYLDPPGAGCGGRTLLTASPVAPAAGTLAPGAASPSASAAGPASPGIAVAIGPHLHPSFPPGTRAPAPDDGPDSLRSQPIPVVLLGSFDDPRLVCDAGSRCDESFLVDRVVWVAGAPWGPTLTVDPALQVDPNIPEIRSAVAAGLRALGDGSVALETAVVLPGALGTLDRAAAAALPPLTGRARQRPVTWVRGLVFQFDASQPVYGRDPTIQWVVLDSITGKLLARSDTAHAASVLPPGGG